MFFTKMHLLELKLMNLYPKVFTFFKFLNVLLLKNHMIMMFIQLSHKEHEHDLLTPDTWNNSSLLNNFNIGHQCGWVLKVEYV